MVKNAVPVTIAILPNGLTKIASSLIALAFPSSIDVECCFSAMAVEFVDTIINIPIAKKTKACFAVLAFAPPFI